MLQRSRRAMSDGGLIKEDSSGICCSLRRLTRMCSITEDGVPSRTVSRRSQEDRGSSLLLEQAAEVSEVVL